MPKASPWAVAGVHRANAARAGATVSMMTQNTLPQLTQRVAELLSRRPGGAWFIVELFESLRGSGVLPADVDVALAELEHDGRILIRANACADPHLDGADLRVAALVRPTAAGVDAVGAAVTAAEATWQRWLGDYLANHRCT